LKPDTASNDRCWPRLIGQPFSLHCASCKGAVLPCFLCLVFFALFSLPCFLCLVFFASFSLPCLLLEGRVYLDSVAPALRGIKTN
jgi:hypothetical protein